ncbi:hypothetical protein J2X73_002930 [Novosphingobium sp. 1748]|nr:hypothetical protein [Novosphingobium sp. 1748]
MLVKDRWHVVFSFGPVALASSAVDAMGGDVGLGCGCNQVFGAGV